MICIAPSKLICSSVGSNSNRLGRAVSPLFGVAPPLVGVVDPDVSDGPILRLVIRPGLIGVDANVLGGDKNCLPPGEELEELELADVFACLCGSSVSDLISPSSMELSLTDKSPSLMSSQSDTDSSSLTSSNCSCSSLCCSSSSRTRTPFWGGCLIAGAPPCLGGACCIGAGLVHGGAEGGPPGVKTIYSCCFKFNNACIARRSDSTSVAHARAPCGSPFMTAQITPSFA